MEFEGIKEKDLETVSSFSKASSSKMDEEFNNFMHRVTDVSSIVKKMASEDKVLQDIGTKEADMYLKCAERDVLENIDEKTIKLTVKSNRTLLNRKAFVDPEPKDEEQMSQEAFMKAVEADAEKRFQERKVRKEKSDTLKKQATIAFRRREFEKAHTLYTRAIDHIKDSCLLYSNRAICEVQLKMYQEALQDTEMALKLEENSLKAWLLSAKAHFCLDNRKKFNECVVEAKNRNPKYATFVHDYVRTFAGDNYNK